MGQKRALITGISGMDGSYLAEYLLEQGYAVYGLVCRRSSASVEKLQQVIDQVELITGDLQDQGSIVRAIEVSEPEELYNLGAQSFVKASWDAPEHTANVTGVGALRVLEAIRQHKPDTRLYQASSSEQFGKVAEVPQNENTRFYPRSPYGVSKVFAHLATVNYRESYSLFASCGICFNHEGPRRGMEFVTQKIANGAAKCALGLATELSLGNLEAQRDWGYAPDYVRAMHLMLQQEAPDDFVLATGESHSVREFCELAFRHFNLNYEDYVRVDERFLRPAEVDILTGDASKARRVLGWEPQVRFAQLVEIMCQAQYDFLAPAAR